MSELVLWIPKRITDQPSVDRFATRLASEARRLSELLGRTREAAVERVGRTLIGRIDGPSGISGWEAAWKAPGMGVVWQGVNEELLGRVPDVETTTRVAGWLLDGDPRMADWGGRWAACAWRGDESVALVCGATGAPTMWWTEGPEGWAAGSRIGLLLDLAGRPPDPDLDGASELVAFGSLISERSIFAGVRRLGSRRRVVIDAGGGRADVETWMTIDRYLAPAMGGDRRPDEGRSASRLRDTVARQLAHSPEPLLLLTGGRDSRAIAAAVAATDARVPVAVGGSPASPDGRTGRQVAARLGLVAAPPGGPPLASSALRIDRLTAWTELDAGIASLRQAIVHSRFFAGELPVPDLVRPLLHGLGGEITRGFYYPGTVVGPGPPATRALRALRLRIHPGLRLRRSPEAALAMVVAALDEEIAPLRPTLEQWLDLYYWQVRCLRWGADLMVGGDILQWHWSPLLARDAVLDAWQLPVAEKATSRWIERMTSRLAPTLADLPYGRRLSPLQRTGIGLSRRAVRSVGRGYPAGALRLMRRKGSPQDRAALRRLWHSVLDGGHDAVWPALIGRRELETLLEVDPAGDACWGLATVELAVRAAR